MTHPMRTLVHTSLRAPLPILAAAALLTACQSGATSNSVAVEPANATATATATAAAVDKRALGPQLLAAAAQGNAVAVRQLLGQGAQVDVLDGQGNTPLLLATAANHIEVARSLLLHGASPNLKNQMQDSAYLLAGAQGWLEIVRMTISYGADLKSTNRYGGTALIPACERGHVETALALIKAGVDVNHVNRLGWTCLVEAVVLSDGGPRHQAIIKALIEARADLSLPDKEGVTALAHARQRGQKAVAQLLQAAGAK